MAADLIARMGLDDSEFDRVARKVNGTSERMARNFDRMGKDAQRGFSRELVGTFATMDVAIRSVERGLDFAAASMARYREEFPGLAAGFNDLESAASRFQMSIGRDLSHAFSDSAGGVASWIDMVDEARVSVVNFIADAARLGDWGNAAAVDAERIAAEQQDRRFQAELRIQRRRQQMEIGIVADPFEREREQAKLEHRQKTEEFQKDRSKAGSNITDAEARAYFDLLEQLFAKRMSDIDAAEEDHERRKAEREEGDLNRKMEAERRKEDARERERERFEKQAEQRELDLLDIEGRTFEKRRREAELAQQEAQAELQRQLEAGDISQREHDREIARIKKLTEARLESIDEEEGAREERHEQRLRSGGIAAGLSGSREARQMEGMLAHAMRGNERDKELTAAEKRRQLLEAIERNTAQPPVATWV